MNIELEMKRLVSNKDINVTILRPTMIFGSMNDLNMSKFIRMIDKLRLFPVIDHGKSLIQPVNAADLGKAYYLVLTTPAERLKTEYVLSGEKPISMLDSFKLIAASLGKKTCFVSCPLSVGVLMARILKMITFGKADFVERVQRMGEDRSYPHAEATVDFGYMPMPFEDGIREETMQYLDQK